MLYYQNRLVPHSYNHFIITVFTTQIDKKREWEMLCRVKPDVIKDKEAERNLQRIATR